MEKISIIIPCFNEENTITRLLELISIQTNKITNYNFEVILINDASNDKTYEKILANKNHVDILINHEKNLGKGAAIKSGLKKSLGEIILIQDADLEYNPENYFNLIDKFKDDKIKVVYGSRFLNKKNFDIYKGLNFNFRLLLNKLFTGFFNLLYRQKLTDVHTGYKLFKREIFNKINLEEDDFSFCVEVSAKIAKNKIDICEVEIDFFPRSYKEGKKIRNIDGLKALFAYIKYRF